MKLRLKRLYTIFAFETFLFYILLILSLSLTNTSTASAQWIITEVMYNPPGTDLHKEWIEIYGPKLSTNIKFYEDGGSHNLNYVQGNCSENCTIIIAEDATYVLSNHLIPQDTFVYDSSWSSLKNTGEEIGLKNDTKIILSEKYPPLAEPGESIHFQNDEWYSGTPTPGKYTPLSLSNNVPEFGALSSLILLAGTYYMIKKRKFRY